MNAVLTGCVAAACPDALQQQASVSLSLNRLRSSRMSGHTGVVMSELDVS